MQRSVDDRRQERYACLARSRAPDHTRAHTPWRTMRKRSSVLVLGFAVTLGGCSAAFVIPPRSTGYERLEDVDCSTGAGLPVADSLVAVPPLVISTAVLLDMVDGSCAGIADEGTHNCGANHTVVAVGAGVLAAAAIASAVYGYSATTRCNREIERLGGNAPEEAPVPEKAPVETDPRGWQYCSLHDCTSKD